MKAIFKKELFKEGYIFYFRFNRNIILRTTGGGIYILDLDYDPEFTEPEVLFLSWSSLENELIDNKAFWIFNNN